MNTELIKTGLALADAGLVNNPTVCIKGMSSFACVCAPCMEHLRAVVAVFAAEVFSDPSPTNQLEA
jgi:hypothetical protein